VKFSLATVLFGVAVMVMAMFMIVRKSWAGLLMVLGLAVAYFVLTVVGEAMKVFYGKDVQGRDRHP
jgi:hypothetical protein